jgi:hypothetical protein
VGPPEVHGVLQMPMYALGVLPAVVVGSRHRPGLSYDPPSSQPGLGFIDMADRHAWSSGSPHEDGRVDLGLPSSGSVDASTASDQVPVSVTVTVLPNPSPGSATRSSRVHDFEALAYQRNAFSKGH